MVVTRFHHYVSYAALIGVCCAVLACGESDKDRPDGPDQQSDAAHGDGALETDLNIACTDVPDDAPANADAAEANDSIEEDMPPIDIGPPRHLCESFTVRQSVEQIHLWNALPETAIEVTDDSGDVVAEGLTDYQGSLVFREIVPGTGYAVRLAADHEEYTGPLTVVSVEDSYPDPSFYEEQELDIGFGYLKTRDGTLLSYFMVLPGPPEEGPYPTLVNYSGYSPSRPGKSLGGDVELFCPTYPILCNAPDFPSGLIMGLVGYAVVGVNVRGTGCSGGAYDFFEPLQLLDGYDVIETVARQPWVKHHKVGMVGLSFPGIAQLFVAKTKPPSLAAIAPFSVIANTGASTLVPGGIHNIGFAMEWIEHVLNKAAPYAHGWITDIVEQGDTVCEEHQLLHSQKLDVIAKIYENPYYTEVAEAVDPSTFMDEVEVPVFLVGQSQDEQTGPHFPVLFDKFVNSPVTRFTMTNGIHMDGFSTQIIAEWANFLAFYVDRDLPKIPAEFSLMAPVFMEQVFGAAMELPKNRFADYTDFDVALADYEAEPDLRVIYESGAHPDVEPGAPQGSFEAHFEAWPIPGTKVSRWYFQPDGTMLQDLPAADGGAGSFESDPEAGDRKLLGSGSVNALHPDWDYRQPVPGKALSYITPPLTEDMVLTGHASADLWIKSNQDDADIEVGITEVRPDGKESYVQMGWLRASRRKLRDDSTELQPISTHYQEDAEPLVSGEWNLLRVEMMPLSHVFRAGSQIRIVIDTPGDSMALWRFDLLEFDGPAVHSIAHQEAYPSSIALPLVPEVDVPTTPPPCEALRAQPCRDYVPYENLPMPAE